MTGDLWTAPAQGPELLSALTEDERYRRFDDLQSRMPGVWDAMRLNHDDESVVVVPSISLDRAVSASGSLSQAYEERFLFLLVLLRQPRLRMVYVTSMPIAPEIVEYYLALLSGVIPSHARARLSLISVNDASACSLSEKLLARPRLLRRIADLVPNPARSHMVPYNTTELERDVALSIGIPMYGADPRLAELGSKTGCRRLFAEVGVPHPLGAENLHSLDEIADALVDMRRERPSMASAIVKLNEGVSGSGNAVVTLTGLPSPGSPGERAEVMTRLRHMDLESESTPFEVYVAKFAEGGGIVEERITGQELQSPSVQLRVLPSGRGRAALDPRPAARRAQRAEVPRMRVPGSSCVRAAHHRARGADRAAARPGGRTRQVRGRLRRGPRRRRVVDAVRHRAQPAQGRHDPSVPHAAVPDRRSLRPRHRALHHATGSREASGGHGPPRVPHAPRPGAGGPVRHRGPARAALRPVASAGNRLPHDQLLDRARPRRHDLGGRHSRRGTTAATARPRGSCWTRRGWRSRSYHYVSDRIAVQAVWYVAYGSNLALDRFRSYLCGGRPSGGLREYAGCRDTRDPASVISACMCRAGLSSRVTRPSGVVAWRSSTGGRQVGSRAAPTSSRQSSSRT